MPTEAETPNYDGYEHLLTLALAGLKADKAAERTAAHMAVTRIRIDADLRKGRADSFALVARGLQKAFDVEAKHRAEIQKHEAREARLREYPAYQAQSTAAH